MRVFKSIGLAAIIVLTGTAAGVRAQQPARRTPRAVPGELIVKFKANANGAARGQARRAIAATAIAALTRHAAAAGEGPTELVRVPPGRIAAGAARPAARRCRGGVRRAELDLHAPENDPLFAQQWALENSGQAVSGMRGAADADIDAPDAWTAAPASSRQVFVGVLDEGIDFSHPDLGAGPGRAIWTNPFDPVDGIDNDGNGYVDDVHGWDFAGNDNSVYDGSAADAGIDAHGTHVAGTIAARRDNGLGVAGVDGERHDHSGQVHGRGRRHDGERRAGARLPDRPEEAPPPQHRRDQQLVGRRRLLPGPARRDRPRGARGDPVHRRGRQRRP